MILAISGNLRASQGVSILSRQGITMKINSRLLGTLCLQLLVASRCLASAADHRLDIYWIDSEGGWERPSQDYLDMKCDRRIVMNPGDQIPFKKPNRIGPGVEITCLAARKHFIEAPTNAPKSVDCENPRRKAADPSDNANSIAL